MRGSKVIKTSDGLPVSQVIKEDGEYYVLEQTRVRGDKVSIRGQEYEGYKKEKLVKLSYKEKYAIKEGIRLYVKSMGSYYNEEDQQKIKEGLGSI